MADNKEVTTIFVNRDFLQILDTASDQIQTLKFDPKALRDVDIVDPNYFGQLISSFIDQNRLTPSPLVYVFAESICYSKDFGQMQEVTKKEEIKSFISSVPFNSVLTKEYVLGDSTRIIGINQGIYQKLSDILEAKGFSSLAAIPAFVLGKDHFLKNALDKDLAEKVKRKLDIIRQMSFVTPETVKLAQAEVLQRKDQFKITNRVLVLAAVFILGLIILIVILVSQRGS